MIIYSPRYMEHNMRGHPENSWRLDGIWEVLDRKNIRGKISVIEPKSASEKDILRVHSQNHHDLVKNVAGKGGGWLDPDTYVNPVSYEIALLAAGGMITAIDSLGESNKYAFCIVRPPGHHATRERPMGFCLFNNIAVGAAYALEKKTAKKVLIFDIDVHHGNGTQDIFYGDERICFISLHQSPHYPGTGSMTETGEGKGKGITINIPLPGGTSHKDYLEIIDRGCIPIINQFTPDLILVSAGFDTNYMDPLGGFNLNESTYFEIGKRLKETGVPTIFTLEGGYDPRESGKGIYSILAAIHGLEWKKDNLLSQENEISPIINDRINEIKKIQGKYWKF